jgi:hypothetical protein
LLAIFKQAFIFENRYLLCSGDIFDEKGISMAELGKETARCIREIQTFTAILQEVFISFFDLRSAANGKLKREQLENFVTSLVVRD